MNPKQQKSKMKPLEENYYVGIDISKDKLDAHCHQWGEVREFPNDSAGIRRLFAALKKLPGRLHIICECSGGYEKGLLSYAFKRGESISAVNARLPRDFARSKGRLAKTDEIDARTLTEFGQSNEPEPSRGRTDTEKALSAAVRRLDSLKRSLVREKNGLENASDSFVRADIRLSIASHKRQIAKVEKHIASLIASDEQLTERKHKLENIKGVGPGTSALILAEMPELGEISNKQVSSLVGVAPFNRDSGKWRGKRTIQGGRGLVRRGLYMPAMSAIRFNPIFKEFYRGLIERNKHHHLAITAVIRKMLCLMNRVLADPSFKLS